jgi:carbamoyl-phosphate synthase large subunit
MVLPPFSLDADVLDQVREVTRRLALALKVRGLCNVQLAVKDGEVYVLEVNPRASRTVPFVGKATGVPLAAVGVAVMLGRTLAEAGCTEEPVVHHWAVKKSVFPFARFAGADVILGPEMRSTGEVMGIDADRGCAVAKAEIAAQARFPLTGTCFLSVRDSDKRDAVFLARKLVGLGFRLLATGGTWRVLQRNGLPAERVLKLAEGRPNVGDKLLNGEIQLVVNTPSGRGPKTDEARIRTLTIRSGIPILTTMPGASAAVDGIQKLKQRGLGVRALQDYYGPRPAMPADRAVAARR